MALDSTHIPENDLDAAIGAAEEMVGTIDGPDLDFDEILNADSTDDIAGLGPRRYDFNRPHNISKIFDKNLQSVAETFAKTGGIDFTSLLRMTVIVEFKGLHQTTYSDYTAELPNPTCASMVTLAPLKGYSLMHIDLSLCFVLMKKLMKFVLFIAAGAGIFKVLQEKKLLPPPDEGIWKPFTGDADSTE